MTSIPGHGKELIVFFEVSLVFGNKGGEMAVDESRLDKPGIFKVPPCNHAAGISWGVTSCKLFLETENKIFLRSRTTR